jgi:hypothetical protein
MPEKDVPRQGTVRVERIVVRQIVYLYAAEMIRSEQVMNLVVVLIRGDVEKIIMAGNDLLVVPAEIVPN